MTILKPYSNNVSVNNVNKDISIILALQITGNSEGKGVSKAKDTKGKCKAITGISRRTFDFSFQVLKHPTRSLNNYTTFNCRTKRFCHSFFLNSIVMLNS